MEKHMPKTVRVVALAAMLLLGCPFIKIANESVAETIGEEGSRYVTYDKLSGYDIIIETIADYGRGNLLPGEGMAFVLTIVFGIAVLAQFTGAMAMKGRFVLYTAIFIFTLLFSILVVIYSSDMLDIVRWGYYSYLASQALLIIIAGNKKRESTL